MSQFYGTVEGSRGATSRGGTKSSGLVTNAAGWRGSVEVRIYEKDGEDYYDIWINPWRGSGGTEQRIACGILDANLTQKSTL